MNDQNYFNQSAASLPSVQPDPAGNTAAPKKETPMTKSMRSQFSFFGFASMVYALFYALCLYKNAAGITYPFFVAGTLCYFFSSMKRLGVPYKKGSFLYVISIFLLGISNCCTNSGPLLRMNKLGIFFLTFVLILHTVYHDKNWNFPKYLGAILRTMGSAVTCIFSPFTDGVAFMRNKKQTVNIDKKYSQMLISILIGIAVAIPLITFMVVLLCSADVVFQNLISSFFTWEISFAAAEDIFKIGMLIAFVFIASYALLSALCKKSVPEEVEEKKVLEPVIGIVVTGMLTLVYLLFSMIQILYLFIGNMKLPEGYTYAKYARQGFFELLVVCVMNLVIVLFCLHFFKENPVLKWILTVICGCTFIMILSSALRMIMYIAQYNLTFLRLFVLWSLAVIFLLMAGVVVYIYVQKFPLFFYSVVVVTVLYIGLSFAHPDYWIAKYNLEIGMEEGRGSDTEYLLRLSADAAPVLLSEEHAEKIAGNYLYLSEAYERKIRRASEEMHTRNFNFSVFTASSYLRD